MYEFLQTFTFVGAASMIAAGIGVLFVLNYLYFQRNRNIYSFAKFSSLIIFIVLVLGTIIILLQRNCQEGCAYLIVVGPLYLVGILIVNFFAEMLVFQLVKVYFNSWLRIIGLVVAIFVVLAVLFGIYYIPYAVNSPGAHEKWSDIAVTQNDPTICNKVHTSIFWPLIKNEKGNTLSRRIQCLQEAAKNTGDKKYCEAIDDVKRSANYFPNSKQDCLLNLQMSYDYIRDFCQKDSYDKVCLIQLNDKFFKGIDIISAFQFKAQETKDPSWCDRIKSDALVYGDSQNNYTLSERCKKLINQQF